MVCLLCAFAFSIEPDIAGTSRQPMVTTTEGGQADGVKKRTGSMLLGGKPASEDEFFAAASANRPPPLPGVTRKRNSLAIIASQQVLVTYVWGSLEFKDEQVEREWRKCAAHSAAPPRTMANICDF